MTVGENIKRIRKEKGLTQKQLGGLCKPRISESTIRKYELGILNPKIETIDRIASALGVSIIEIAEHFTFDEYKKTQEHKQTEIYENATLGVIAILKEIYGEVTEKNVEDEYGESFYYLVGKGENKFILYEGDIDKLLKYLKSSIPFIVDEMKDARPERKVIEEIKSSLNDPAYIEYVKKLIDKLENNNKE